MPNYPTHRLKQFATLKLGEHATPTSLVNGDVWQTTDGSFVYADGRHPTTTANLPIPAAYHLRVHEWPAVWPRVEDVTELFLDIAKSDQELCELVSHTDYLSELLANS